MTPNRGNSTIYLAMIRHEPGLQGESLVGPMPYWEDIGYLRVAPHSSHRFDAGDEDYYVWVSTSRGRTIYFSGVGSPQTEAAVIGHAYDFQQFPTPSGSVYDVNIDHRFIGGFTDLNAASVSVTYRTGFYHLTGSYAFNVNRTY